jgi:hypothetical protein
MPVMQMGAASSLEGIGTSRIPTTLVTKVFRVACCKEPSRTVDEPIIKGHCKISATHIVGQPTMIGMVRRSVQRNIELSSVLCSADTTLFEFESRATSTKTASTKHANGRRCGLYVTINVTKTTGVA